jgi:hypothetical protein
MTSTDGLFPRGNNLTTPTPAAVYTPLASANDATDGTDLPSDLDTPPAAVYTPLASANDATAAAAANDATASANSLRQGYGLKMGIAAESAFKTAATETNTTSTRASIHSPVDPEMMDALKFELHCHAVGVGDLHRLAAMHQFLGANKLATIHKEMVAAAHQDTGKCSSIAELFPDIPDTACAPQLTHATGRSSRPAYVRRSAAAEQNVYVYDDKSQRTHTLNLRAMEDRFRSKVTGYSVKHRTHMHLHLKYRAASLKLLIEMQQRSRMMVNSKRMMNANWFPQSRSDFASRLATSMQGACLVSQTATRQTNFLFCSVLFCSVCIYRDRRWDCEFEFE